MNGGDGVEWEQQVEGYLSEHGYDTQCRARVAGHEIDVFGQRFDDRLAVECKDWESPVGVSPIRDIKSKADDIDARPGIAYTSRLTRDAAEKARRWEFELIPYERVCYDDSGAGIGRVEFLDPGAGRPALSPTALAGRIVEELPELTAEPIQTREAIREVVAAELDDAGVPVAEPTDEDVAAGEASHALAHDRGLLRHHTLDLDALAALLVDRMVSRGHTIPGIEPAVKHGLEGELPVPHPDAVVQLVDGNEVLLWQPDATLDPIPIRALAESIRQTTEPHLETDAVTFLEGISADLSELLVGTRLPIEE